MTRNSILRSSVILSGVSLASLAMANPAFAQSAPSSAPADTTVAATDDAEIIVTATKRAANVQNVPIAITALSSAQVAASGVTGTDGLRAVVPALNVTKGVGGFGLPRIRGVGATGQGNGIENPVAVYVDGVYYAASSGVLQSLFDVEQVAVLKGPQGTLFGRNATGGLIQITTRGPSDTWTGKAELGYGNYKTMKGGAFLAGPLSSTLTFSLSGQYENRDKGFGANRFTGHEVQAEETWAMRGKLQWEPDADTKIVLAGDFNGTNASSPAFINFGGLNTQGVNVPAVITGLGGDPHYDIYADADPYLHGRQRGVSLTVDHDLGGAKLRSITAYRKTELNTFFDPDGTTRPTLMINNFNKDKNFTQELDLISDGSGPLKWVIGAFYMSNKSGEYPGRTTGLTVPGGLLGYSDENNEVGLKSWSGFAEGTYALGESTNLTAGIRYTHDERTLNASDVVFDGVTTTTTGFGEQSRTFKKFSWKVSIDHRFSPELMVYASYNRGFRAGTFVPQATPIAILEPEVLDAFEVGFKSDLLNRKLRINVSAYSYDQSSVQVMQVLAGVQNVYSARGGARIYGIDGDFTLRATDNLRFFGGFSYNHSRYKSFTDAILSIPFPVSGTFSPTQYSYVDSTTGATVVNTTCLGTFVPPNLTTQAQKDNFYRNRLGGNCMLRGDASGNRLQNTPDWTLSAGGNLDIPSPIGKFSLAGNVYYNSGYVGTADERVIQASFTTINASLTWRHPNEHVYVRVWANNLTNAYYRAQIGASNSGDNGTSGAPRTFGGTLGFEF